MRKIHFEAVVDNDGVMTLPEDFLQQEDWRVGDEISFKIKEDVVTMRNVSKEVRDRIAERELLLSRHPG